MKRLIVLLCLSCLVLPTWAARKAKDAGQLYQVEVLIFERPQYEALGTEVWPEVKGVSFRKAIRLSQWQEAESLPMPSSAEDDIEGGFRLDNLPKAFTELPSDKLHMGYTETMLKKRLGYKVLAHVSWYQPILSKNFARPIYIGGGDRLQQEAMDWRHPFLVQHKPARGRELKGMIKLSQSRYINLQANLLLTLADLPEGQLQVLADQGYNTQHAAKFHLLQSRRMKEDEMHYLDHPLFGMLIKVTPYQDPTAEKTV